MSNCTRIYIDERGWVKENKVEENAHIRDPQPLASDELNLGFDGPCPIRKPALWRLTKPEEQEDTDLEGNPITVTVDVPIPWKYCKVVDNEVVEMTEAEKIAKDEELVIEDATEKQNEQNAKSQELKNREKKAKDLIIAMGGSIPVQEGQIDSMVDTVMTNVFALYAENKYKEAGELHAKATALLALWVKLGDDIYSPLLGDGGE